MQVHYAGIMPDDLDWLVERSDWTVDTEERVATYDLEAGWLARIRPARQPGKTYERWYISLIESTGHAVWTSSATTPHEAVRVAEGHVRGPKWVGGSRIRVTVCHRSELVAQKVPA